MTALLCVGSLEKHTYYMVHLIKCRCKVVAPFVISVFMTIMELCVLISLLVMYLLNLSVFRV